MISFSRGSRSCICMNLAYAELYLTLVYLFRWFEVVLHGVGREDIEDWKDCFVAVTRKHSMVSLRKFDA